MPQYGVVVGFDLTVPDADRVRDFYADVLGWRAEPLDMGGYADYVMVTADGTPVAGVCHARGANADLPPQWLTYLRVVDLDASIDRVRALGGAVVAGPKGDPPGPRYVVVRDPAGAHVALLQSEA
ncbi:VOC family protein [Micromonospora sp. NBC_01813]|uniref:VOC family protein n=1 Tax=Micromonospora sp. NBC_01813 TaxID=2975988 RepID=UPI002DD9C8B9|nr:VOC family protein [Micromonospora sp. NBC_01813]WSA12882.1 VOC family protein [Micromonospora sp. NBC_01813]